MTPEEIKNIQDAGKVWPPLAKSEEIIQSEPVPFDPEADIERARKAASALMKVVRMSKPLKLGGKEYLYFEHWQTIAKFFNASVGIEKIEKIEETDRHTLLVTKSWEAKSVVYQNGIIIGGAIASCSRDEKQWADKPEFQLKSMAGTRAMAKALRSIFGYVAVLANFQATPAEELIGNEEIKIEMDEPFPSQARGITSIPPLKYATDKQKSFINTLRKKKGLAEMNASDMDELTSLQASDLIKGLQS